MKSSDIGLPEGLSGSLYSTDFLTTGIRKMPLFGRGDAHEEAFSGIKSILTKMSEMSSPNEDVTIDMAIRPILDVLGWEHVLGQQTLAKRGRQDVPDHVLFTTIESRDQAAAKKDSLAAYRNGTICLEAKRWERPLDKVTRRKSEIGTPSSQMLRYLRRIDDLTNGDLRYGILTNGRRWRLYWSGASFVSEDFLEFDLFEIAGLTENSLFGLDDAGRRHWFDVFLTCFAKSAFVPTGASSATFHDLARGESAFFEGEVTKELSETVFREVFPALAKAIYSAQPDTSVETVRDNTLIVLYRLLFVLYAEDRNLLPMRKGEYRLHSLRETVRLPVNETISAGRTLPTVGSAYWSAARTIFRMVDKGEAELGLPPYNGGLFSQTAHSLLNTIEISDKDFAPVIDALSFAEIDGERRYVNYRNLSVQQLGAIYERLLNYRFVKNGDNLEVSLDSFARKESGSYYTPDNLVSYMVSETLSPFANEAAESFHSALSKTKDGEGLEPSDPAKAILALKVCDPAMGSGHFLVSIVDWLTDSILEAMADAEFRASELDLEYTSPLAADIERIRATILNRSEREGWVVDDNQLDDRHIVRRMVLKRCIYGVDKNPMAVELAKVSLWLHTFTVGAPLSFLDHHLRCGDALFGTTLKEAFSTISDYGTPLATSEIIQKAAGAASAMARIEASTDIEVAQTKESASIYKGIRAMVREAEAIANFTHALKWIAPSRVDKKALESFFSSQFGDVDQVISGKSSLKAPRNRDGQHRKNADVVEDFAKVKTIFNKANDLIEREKFFCWQTQFPGVWNTDDSTHERTGGFNAIIGNPPWEKVKLNEKDYFSARNPEIASFSNASRRKKAIKDLEKTDPKLFWEYQEAYGASKDAMRVAGKGGDYPLTGHGDLNLYPLFVERADTLLAEGGLVGLLTPVGIGTDFHISPFFNDLSSNSRLAAFIAFENAAHWLFEDVHAEDQPTFLLFGHSNRQYETFKFATKLHSIPEKGSSKVTQLDVGVCQRVNPNTGTAPMFRDQRALPILMQMYSSGRVFQKDNEPSAWPVKYSTDFHMTNDSENFYTADDLSKMQAFPIEGGDWQDNEGKYVPLLEGKSIQIHNHRYASITRNQNASGQGKAIKSTVKELSNSDFVTTPWYWIHEKHLSDIQPYVLAFNDVANANNTRTSISAIVPKSGYGNTLPVLRHEDYVEASDVALMSGAFGSILFDFAARQKIQSRHLNKFVISQLPVIPLNDFYSTKFGNKSAAEIIQDAVLRLTYVSKRMMPFAKDMDYVDDTGEVLEPFTWDSEERQKLNSKIDAVIFHMYEITKSEDIDFVFSTFPKIATAEESEHGIYWSRELTKAYVKALAAGLPDAQVDVRR